MAASYKKLFKLLIDRNMKKGNWLSSLEFPLPLSQKMGKYGVSVNSDVLVKICQALQVNIGDIMDVVS